MAYRRNETRFRIVERQDPARFRSLLREAEKDIKQRFDLYRHMSQFGEEREGKAHEAAE